MYMYACIYCLMYIHVCGRWAYVPSCVLKGLVGPYGALSPSAIPCQFVRGVSGALKRPGRGSRMTPCLLSML